MSSHVLTEKCSAKASGSILFSADVPGARLRATSASSSVQGGNALSNHDNGRMVVMWPRWQVAVDCGRLRQVVQVQ